MQTAQANRSFIVEGNNWRVKVTMDDDDMLMSFPDQAQEAASKAVEIFYGQSQSPESLQIQDESQPPIMGAALCVYDEIHLKDESKYLYIPSFLALADSGHYKESFQMQQIFFAHKMQEAQHAKNLLIQRVGGLVNFAIIEEYSNNLLLKATNNGTLPITPEIEAEISAKVEAKVQQMENKYKNKLSQSKKTKNVSPKSTTKNSRKTKKKS